MKACSLRAALAFCIAVWSALGCAVAAYLGAARPAIFLGGLSILCAFITAIEAGEAVRSYKNQPRKP